MAFDVLWLDGKNLRGQPLTRWKRALERVIPATSTVLSRVFAVEGRGRDLFAAAERLVLEDVVAKRKADTTRPRRCGTKSGIARTPRRKAAPSCSTVSASAQLCEEVPRSNASLALSLSAE